MILSLIEKSLNVIILFMMILSGIVTIFLRYYIRIPFRGSEEFIRLSLMAIVFIGTSMAHKKNRHIRVGVLSSNLSYKIKNKIDILAEIFIIVFLILIFLVGASFTIKTWNIETITLGVSSGFFAIWIPISTLSMIYTSIRNIVKLIKLERGK